MRGGRNVISCLWLPYKLQTDENNTNALFTLHFMRDLVGGVGVGDGEREREREREKTPARSHK